MRRAVRVGLWTALVGAAGIGLVRAARWFRDVGTPPPPASWPKAETGPKADVQARHDPLPVADPVDGTCPASHPVKAKTSSGLYHLPGMLAYDRTNPDRCFVDAAAADAAGFIRAKR